MGPPGVAWRTLLWWYTVAVCLSQSTAQTQVAQGTASHILVKEVQEGETVSLPCPSNDADHRFLFWQLDNDKVVGPANHLNSVKYEYEVLTGELVIKHTSIEDAGQYKCVSKGIKQPTFLIEPVELVVKKDWETLWENDTKVNVLRVFLALIVMAVLGGIVFVIFRMRRTGYIKGDDLSDDDMPDDGPYHSTTQRNTQEDSMCLVDTELPRALNSMYTDRL